jgi:hypothetical protein
VRGEVAVAANCATVESRVRGGHDTPQGRVLKQPHWGCPTIAASRDLLVCESVVPRVPADGGSPSLRRKDQRLELVFGSFLLMPG